MDDKKYFVHNSSFVDKEVSVGKGTKIWHFSHIQSKATIGKNCTLGQNVFVAANVVIGNNVKIQNNVSVYEGVEIEDNVFCGPSVVFTNILKPRSEFPQNTSDKYLKTLIRKSASIGANSTIVCGISVGQYAMIGAGSVVTKNVPDFALIFGNPARITAWVNEVGDVIKFDKNGKSQCKKFFFDGANVKLLDNL